MTDNLELTGWRMRRSVNSAEWISFYDNLEGSGERQIRSEWFVKGWAKSFDYLTSKRMEARKEDPVFRDFHFGCEESLFPLDGSIAKGVRSRRSTREFSDTPLSIDTMGVLEKICDPVVKEMGYFLIYAVLFNMKGIDAGLYKLDCHCAGFVKVGQCPNRSDICKLISGMDSSMTSGMTLFLVVDLDIAMETIGESAYLRRVFMESGIIMQRILMGLTFRNISGVPSPAIQDVNTKTMLDLDRKRNIWPLYSCALGYKK